MAIDFSDVIQVLAPVGAALTFISGVWWKMEAKINVGNEKADEIQKQLSDFKLKVAEEYASWDTVKTVETRLTERMDSLSHEVMKMPDVIVDRLATMFKLLNMK